MTSVFFIHVVPHETSLCDKVFKHMYVAVCLSWIPLQMLQLSFELVPHQMHKSSSHACRCYEVAVNQCQTLQSISLDLQGTCS